MFLVQVIKKKKKSMYNSDGESLILFSEAVSLIEKRQPQILLVALPTQAMNIIIYILSCFLYK